MSQGGDPGCHHSMGFVWGRALPYEALTKAARPVRTMLRCRTGPRLFTRLRETKGWPKRVSESGLTATFLVYDHSLAFVLVALLAIVIAGSD
jgi:hypothetical protein